MVSDRVFCTRAVLFVAGLVLSPGCGMDFSNLTAPFGGDTAGSRGQVQIVFLNNTPYRSVFTFATYDQTDPSSEPDFRQFGHNEDGLVLDGDSTSPIGSLDCARVFSIGGPRMLALIQKNLLDATVAQEAMIEGVEFFRVEAAAGDAAAAPAPVSQGQAPPFEALLGVDFPCHALLIVRFEIDDLGPAPFRIAFELIPSQSTRYLVCHGANAVSAVVRDLRATALRAVPATDRCGPATERRRGTNRQLAISRLASPARVSAERIGAVAEDRA